MLTSKVENTAAPTTFHRFPDLPFEIREMIWELCLPSRLVQPWYYGLHPVRQLEKYSPIADVSKEAFRAVLHFGCWAEVMVKHMHRVPLVPSTSPYLAQRIWFHKKDVVYLGIVDCHTLTNLPTISRQTRNSDITRPALDPATRLLISSDLGDRLGWPANPRYRKGQPLKEKYETTPAGKVLYEKFLRTRKSFMVEFHRFEVILEGPAREDTVRAGMFGLWGNEPAIIDADDTTALRKYKALLEKGNGTYVFDSATDADVLYGIDEIKALGRRHDSHDGAFMRRLLRVLGDLEEVKFDWGDVVRENGEVNRDHPMVKKLGFSLPECKSVFVFELLSEEDTKREKDRLFWLYSSDDSDDEESEDEREN